VEQTILIGLGLGGMAALIRALPWPEPWKSKKPLGCDVCLSFWTFAVFYLPFFGLSGPGWPDPVAAVATYGVMVLVLRLASGGGPGSFSDLVGKE